MTEVWDKWESVYLAHPKFLDSPQAVQNELAVPDALWENCISLVSHRNLLEKFLDWPCSTVQESRAVLCSNEALLILTWLLFRSCSFPEFYACSSILQRTQKTHRRYIWVCVCLQHCLTSSSRALTWWYSASSENCTGPCHSITLSTLMQLKRSIIETLATTRRHHPSCCLVPTQARSIRNVYFCKVALRS